MAACVCRFRSLGGCGLGQPANHSHPINDVRHGRLSILGGDLEIGSRAGFRDCRRPRHICHRRAWIKRRDPSPVAERIIAIEAKLSDWRRALYQASRYLDYANQSWVVLDSKAFASACLQVDEFQHRGIGLAGVSPRGEFEVACAAVLRTPRLPQRFWLANAAISRHLFAARITIARTIAPVSRNSVTSPQLVEFTRPPYADHFGERVSAAKTH